MQRGRKGPFDLRTVIAGYLDGVTFSDVRRAAEAAEGGTPAPLPRFAEVLSMLVRSCEFDLSINNAVPWMMARVPVVLDGETAHLLMLAAGSVTTHEWLDLMWRVSPADQAITERASPADQAITERASPADHTSGAGREPDCRLRLIERAPSHKAVAALALLGPAESRASRRALAAATAPRHGVLMMLSAYMGGVRPEGDHYMIMAALAAVGGAAEARRAFVATRLDLLEYDDLPADAIDRFDSQLMQEFGDIWYGDTNASGQSCVVCYLTPSCRHVASVVEFRRRRVRAARANMRAYALWRAAAVASCRLVRDAALRYAGYVHH